MSSDLPKDTELKSSRGGAEQGPFDGSATELGGPSLCQEVHLTERESPVGARVQVTPWGLTM